LNCPLNVNLAFQPEPLDLVQDHVDDDEGSRASDAGGAVHDDGALGRGAGGHLADRRRRANLERLLHRVHVVKEVEDAAGVVGDAVVGPRLEEDDKKKFLSERRFLVVGDQV
jgi:hypothetical protein